MKIEESHLYQYVLAKRAKLSPLARSRSFGLGVKIRWNYPYVEELRYKRLLKAALMIYVTIPMTEEAKKGYQQSLRGDSEAVLHMDGLIELKGAITRIGLAAFPNSTFLNKVADSISKQSKEQWGKFVRQATGVDITVFETEAEREVVAEWVAENVDRLRDYSTLHAKKINKIISDGAANDESWEVISEKIEIQNDRLTSTQADYIARDSTGDLSSRLNETMSEEAGIEAYKWNTKGDRKVRGNPRGLYPKTKYSHYKMNGVLRRWSDGKISTDGGRTWRRVSGKEEPEHAGRAKNCRCTGEPFFLFLVQAADRELSNS